MYLPWHRQLGPRVAVGLARLLILLPPAWLARALQLISRGARPATFEQADYARRASMAVSARCAGLGCLQRSVASGLMCRAHGRWPDWCTGFRVLPFGAHAWIEVDGCPVGEFEGLDAFHTVLAVRVRDEAVPVRVESSPVRDGAGRIPDGDFRSAGGGRP